MTKKRLKILLCIISLVTVGAGIYYYFRSKKKENISQDSPEENEPDSIDYSDALDLSSLKFSRHYVDLR